MCYLTPTSFSKCRWKYLQMYPNLFCIFKKISSILLFEVDFLLNPKLIDESFIILNKILNRTK